MLVVTHVRVLVKTLSTLDQGPCINRDNLLIVDIYCNDAVMQDNIVLHLPRYSHNTATASFQAAPSAPLSYSHSFAIFRSVQKQPTHFKGLAHAGRSTSTEVASG